ncbi:hypothetical protein KC19_3G217100 [Ceratodon purpureus]|uniref:Protein kinase domain-containing protein n=1 Tax=Ceratodon purpureus TaxID=3225 RepID=A0A8T0INF0_CERPU|nr:hypothetical protein KC19_3G217100 [Ceratodon purpureus]
MNKMGVWGAKRRQCGHQFSMPGVCTVALLLILGSIDFVGAGTNTYWRSDLAALQTIWGAWNTSTPDLASNLAGWSSNETNFTSIYPCQSLSNPDATIPNWRGIFCLKTNYNSTTDDGTIEIVGLSLQNASIEGYLPPDIGNLSSMTTLELTGNPNLTGPLPTTFWQMWINILDLHDNGFTGPLPDELLYSWNLLHLDVSGNQLNGSYPFNQTSSMDYLQVLSIARNHFRGEIPDYAFVNKTELEKLDISDNNFTGTLPPLDRMFKYLNYLDVSGNQFKGPLPDLRKFQSLRHVNLGRNRFQGTANLQDILNLQNPNASLDFVDLSHNNLSGPLPSWNASNLGPIQELYLDNNTLSGILDIRQMYDRGLLQSKNSTDNSTDQKLRIMSLSNNSIGHVIYDPFVIANVDTVFKLQGNPYCERYDSSDDGQRCFCTQICFVTPPKTNSRKIIIIAATTSVFAVALILLVVIGAILYKNRRYKQYLQLEFKQKFEEFDVKPTIFSYNELRAATRDFSEDMKLGQGGYGAVYKGVLPNGNVVAVKQLYIKQAQNANLDEFSNEVVLITGMKHRNLVNLKGCCLRESQRLLVYEYVDNYDVDQIILGSRRQALNWPIRLKICLGVARGLHYLHALAHPRVIHRDIKASNVLLDKNLEPKIADFGLALLFPDNQSHIMTVHVAGTKGYLAPEYASLGQLSDKVDVYSFGVLCLEIISGRRNIDETKPLEQIYLSKWAWLLHEQNNLMELVDPQLHLNDEEMHDVQRVINVCLICIQNAAEKRPTMARVVSILQSDTESEIQVLGEGNEPSYKSNRSRTKSLDYKSNGLESVSEEAGSSNGTNGVNGYHKKPREPGSLDDFSIAVELSEIRAR